MALCDMNRADARVRIEREHTFILFAVAHKFGIPTSTLIVAPGAIERLPLIPETDKIGYLTGRNNYGINQIHNPFIPYCFNLVLSKRPEPTLSMVVNPSAIHDFPY